MYVFTEIVHLIRCIIYHSEPHEHFWAEDGKTDKILFLISKILILNMCQMGKQSYLKNVHT